MSDLIAFVRARLDEREAMAKAAGSGTWSWEQGYGDMCNDPECPYGQLMARVDGEDIPARLMDVHGYDVAEGWQGAAHIAYWDPARALAEVAAMRAIVDACERAPEADFWGRDILLALIQPYADHPDFDLAWLP